MTVPAVPASGTARSSALPLALEAAQADGTHEHARSHAVALRAVDHDFSQGRTTHGPYNCTGAHAAFGSLASL